MKKKEKLRGKWLIALGVIMMLLSAWNLNQMPTVLQYSFVAPKETPPADGAKADSQFRGLLKGWEDVVTDKLGECLSYASISARDYGAVLVSDVESTGTGTLTAVGENWFDIYKKYLTTGRLMNAQEMEDGERVIVLDEELAFKLFPTTDPLEGKIKLGEIWFQVIGTVRRSRSVGDYERFAAYIPAERAASEHMQFETIEISGLPIPKSGASKTFEEAAVEWTPGGSFQDTSKEVMRATMIVRVLFILFGMYVLLWITRKVNGRVAIYAGQVHARLQTHYFRKMIFEIAGRALIFCAGYAVLIGAAYALLKLAIDPMFVFTEWIPDVIVEMSSITERFWQRTVEAAQPIFVRTHEFSEIRFWAGIMRWGVIAALCGFVIMGRRKKTKAVDNPSNHE